MFDFSIYVRAAHQFFLGFSVANMDYEALKIELQSVCLGFRAVFSEEQC